MKDADIRPDHSVQSRTAPSRKFTMNRPTGSAGILPVAVGIMLLVLGFWGGTAFERHHKNGQSTMTNQQDGRFGANTNRAGNEFGRRRAGRGIGSVTAVSSTSITVKSRFGDTDKTYTINSTTTVTNDGQSASISDIKTGDTVAVTASTTDATVAMSIVLNPSVPSQPSLQNNGTDQSDTDPQSTNTMNN